MRLLSAKEAPAEAGAKDKGNLATPVAHVQEGMPQIISNLYAAVKQNTKNRQAEGYPQSASKFIPRSAPPGTFGPP